MAESNLESKPQAEARMIEASPASQPEPTLAGFEHRFATVGGVRLHFVSGGKEDDDVVVLLAGFPESWFAWRKVMPLLAPPYKVIAPDLPGQGDSDRPASGYDTKTLATTVHGLLEQLGKTRCFLAGHDVGAWVAYSHAALFGDEVRGLALLDAGIPGVTLPDALPIAPERAWRTWHFAFHAIPDLPELLITGREREYLDWFLRRKAANPQAFSEADVDEYLRVFKKPGGLRAGLAHYREAALSAQQNRELRAAGKLRPAVLALGGDQGYNVEMPVGLGHFS
jgi:pimeloyl-ACP methyl ester carboxylesterase